MADDEEIVVNIDGGDEQVHKTNGAVVVEGDTTDLAVAELKAQYEEGIRKDAEKEARLAAERTARQAAERRAEAAEREVTTARTEVVDSQSDSIASGLAQAQAEAEAATSAYATAMEAGNFVDAGKAQRRIAKAEAQIVRLDEAKADLETRKAAPAPERQAPQRTEAPTDPVEAYVAGRSEPTANWLRQHRDWIVDPRKNAKLTSAHYSAVAEGLTPDTDDYFSHVETAIGLKQAPGKTNGANGNGSGKPRRASVPVAPVTQSGGSGTNGGGNEVRLSRGEAAAATDGTHVWNYDDPSGQKKFKKGEPIGIQEMARRKLSMQKQGLYDKTYTEA